MEAPGVAVVPWRQTSKWRNRLEISENETLRETKSHSWSQRRWSWILTGHFGRFLWRTVPSLCAWCVSGHTNAFVLWRRRGYVWMCVCKCVWESCIEFPLRRFLRLVNMQHHGISLLAKKRPAHPFSPNIISPAKVVRWGGAEKKRKRIFSPANVCLGSDDREQDEFFLINLIMLNHRCINTITACWSNIRQISLITAKMWFWDQLKTYQKSQQLDSLPFFIDERMDVFLHWEILMTSPNLWFLTT